MENLKTPTPRQATISEQIAHAVNRFQKLWTGYPARSVSVVLSNETLLVTLRGALTPAEQALAKTPAGAAQVQEYHRQLFEANSHKLQLEIKRITGVEVRQSKAQVQPNDKALSHAFTQGTLVQVYLLSTPLPLQSGSTDSYPQDDHIDQVPIPSEPID